MKQLTLALCLPVVITNAYAKPNVWQPSAGHAQIPIWPGAQPDAHQMPDQNAHGRAGN